jgi:hypothetical protein
MKPNDPEVFPPGSNHLHQEHEQMIISSFAASGS